MSEEDEQSALGGEMKLKRAGPALTPAVKWSGGNYGAFRDGGRNGDAFMAKSCV